MLEVAMEEEEEDQMEVAPLWNVQNNYQDDKMELWKFTTGVRWRTLKNFWWNAWKIISENKLI